MKKVCTLYCFLLAAVLLSCSCNQPPVSPGVEGTPSIIGKLIQSDGITPAAGAFVTLYPRDALVPVGGPAKMADLPDKVMVEVGDDGTFSIDSCVAGVYALEGADADGNAVRLDSVVVTDPAITKDVAQQSLRSTGALQGKVLLDNGGDPENVFILVFGSERFIQVNRDGSYVMNDLPYGKYTLKFVCVLKECGLSKTVSVTVEPGQTTGVEDITLSVPEISAPANAILTYDSQRMLVTLSWEPCSDAGIIGYNIYRYNTAEAEQYPLHPVNADPITGNSFTDYNVNLDHNYVYGVTSVSVNGSVSRKTDPLSVTIVLTSFDVDTIPVDLNRNLDIHFDPEDKLMVAKGGSVPADGREVYSLGIDFFNSDLTFDRSVVISDSLNDIREVHLTDKYVVFSCEPSPVPGAVAGHPDSSGGQIHCYSYTGEKRYTMEFHKAEVKMFAECNDTLYVLTDTLDNVDGGISSFAAYDTAGNKLFSVENMYAYRMLDSPNGSLFVCLGNRGPEEFKGSVNLYSAQTNSISEIVLFSRNAQFSRVNAIDVKNGLYYLSGPEEIAVYSKDGSLISRLGGVVSLKVAINSQGVIALPWRKKTILFTPRNN